MPESATSHIPQRPEQEITFFGKMLTFSRLQLHTADLTKIETHLASLLSNKESHIPVVIDSDIEQDLTALVDLLWSWGLQPIGVVTGILDEQAIAQKLAIFPADGKRIQRIVPPKTTQTGPTTPAPSPTTDAQQADSPTPIINENTDSSHNLEETKIDTEIDTVTIPDITATQTEQEQPQPQTTQAQAPNSAFASEQITSLVYDQMLRSGQSINHVGGDLILTNSINNGAEAITDNSLHIYGRAQGRLVAGATGDKDARIFCQSFNPSLVSVAGTYCLRDNIPADVIDKPVQVSYKEGQGLVFTIMNNH